MDPRTTIAVVWSTHRVVQHVVRVQQHPQHGGAPISRSTGPGPRRDAPASTCPRSGAYRGE